MMPLTLGESAFVKQMAERIIGINGKSNVSVVFPSQSQHIRYAKCSDSSPEGGAEASDYHLFVHFYLSATALFLFIINT